MMTKGMKGALKDSRGFTLMELIIVVAILAILVTLAVLYYGNTTEDTYATMLVADLRQVDTAFSLYQTKYNEMPVLGTTPEDLEDTTNGNSNVPGTLTIDTLIDVYPIDRTDANFMAYIKKTTFLLKGVEGGDSRGAGKLFYVDAARDVATSQTPVSGSGTSIQLAAAASAVDDYYNDCTIDIVAGAGLGQSRTVVDYDGGTQTATLSSALETVLDASSRYTIRAPVKRGDLVFVQTTSESANVIKDSSGNAIYKY